MFDTLNPVITNLLKTGQVFLSFPVSCPECQTNVRLIGEHKTHGNWYCPNCVSYWPYDTLTEKIPWEKRAWKVQSLEEILVNNSPMSTFSVPKSAGVLTVPKNGLRGSLAPLGDPLPVFPQNLTTGFLVPSYGYKLKRKRRYLLAVAEDGTRTGRTKGAFTWGFDLVFKNRTKDEYDTLLAFWELRGYAGAFTYVDAMRNSTHTTYFDSEIEAEGSSFDALDFSVQITE
jgi:hypothetical protein